MKYVGKTKSVLLLATLLMPSLALANTGNSGIIRGWIRSMGATLGDAIFVLEIVGYFLALLFGIYLALKLKDQSDPNNQGRKMTGGQLGGIVIAIFICAGLGAIMSMARNAVEADGNQSGVELKQSTKINFQ